MKSFLVAFLSVLVFSSCHYFGGKRVVGNGQIVTRDHNVGSFQRVEVGGAIEVYIKQDSSQQPVKVETDENLQDLIEISVANGVLHISTAYRYNLEPSKQVKVSVAAPIFNGLVVSGASHLYSENRLTSTESMDIDLSGASELKLDIKAPRINSQISGASTAVISGETRDFVASGSGASHYKCFDLMTENTSVDLSGACNADVFASVKLDVEASGASGVKYKGAAALKQDLSGASGISKVD